MTTRIGDEAPTDTASRPGVFLVYRELPASAKMLLFGMFINRLGAFLPFFLVLYMTSTGYPAGQAGVALSAYGAGSIAGNTLGGWLTDRIGHRRTIMTASAAAGLATTAIIYAPNLYVLMVLVASAGALGAAYRPASSALLASTVSTSRYTMVFAIYRMAMSLGTIGGPLVGAALVAINFGALFWVEGLVLVAFALAACALLPSDQVIQKEAAGTVAGSGTIFTDYRFLLFLLSVFSLSVVYFQHVSTLPLYIVGHGHSMTFYATLVTINAITVTFLELPMTKVVQHWSPRVALAVNYTLIGIGLAMYAAPWGTIWILVATAVWSLGEIIGAPTFFSYPAKVAPDGMKGRYLGASGAMLGLAFAAGPAIGLPVWTLLGDSFWLVCGLVCVLSVAAMAVGVLPSHQIPDEPTESDKKNDEMVDNCYEAHQETIQATVRGQAKQE